MSLSQTSAAIERGITEKMHLGAQLYVSRGAKVVADVAFGNCTTDTINLWWSSGKPVTAYAIAQLRDRKMLDWDDRIAKFIPEFATRGKEPITIRHLLTHTGGFRVAPGLKWDDPFDVAVKKVCAMPLESGWIPGQAAGYHPATSWYILAEIVRRLDGRPFDKYVREAVFLPLGMGDSWIGMPAEKYREYCDRIGSMHGTKDDVNSESAAAAVRPGSNSRGPIRELGKFYEMLLEKKDEPAVREIITRQRVGMYDRTFKHVMDWGLGFIINTDAEMPYGYGPQASRDTFGHSGNQSSCAFCDPQNELVVAWLCNGMPGEQLHLKRQNQINAAIYEDLNI